MKKKTIIAISALALCALVVSCKKTDLLFEAVSNNNIKEVARLIEAGANVNATDDYGETALMMAVSSEGAGADMAKLLIAAGADVNARDKGGKTALIIAEDHNAKDAMALLKAVRAEE